MFNDYLEMGLIDVVQDGYDTVFVFNGKTFSTEIEVEEYIIEDMYLLYTQEEEYLKRINA